MSLSFTRAQIAKWAKDAGPESPLHAMLKATKPARERRKSTPPPPSQQRTMTIIVPMPEPLLNSGKGKSRHWRAKVKERKAYCEALDARAQARLIPAPPSPALGVVRVTSTMYLGNRMDADNAMARHKWPLDWLQKNGYLHNDKLVEWTGVPSQVIGRSHEYRIELEFREP
jgi:Holliday junction resolvase RusA-like endonuclease